MEPRATYTGSPQAWSGAIKLGKRVVWKCGHRHHNRDQGGYTWGTAACGCANSVLKVALKTEAEIEEMQRAMREYHSHSSMSSKIRWNAEYELGVREEVRRALGL